MMQAHPKLVLITLLPFCRGSQPCAGSATCFFPMAAVTQVRGILYPHRSCLDLYRFIHCHFGESSPVPLNPLSPLCIKSFLEPLRCRRFLFEVLPVLVAEAPCSDHS
jgi:hypothetical protein